MNEQEVIRLYAVEMWTLRRVAAEFGTNHHMVRRVLQRHGVAITAKHRRQPMSAEHRRKIGEATRRRVPWSKGKTMSESYCRANMKGRLGGTLDLDRYPDYQRLKFLTALLAKRKPFLGGDDLSRQSFLDHFYFDEAFNAVYDAWLASGKNKWFYPSLDHKHAASNGGGWGLDNLRFITWFENRAKAEMGVEEWETFRESTCTHSRLFIDQILRDYRRKGGSIRRED